MPDDTVPDGRRSGGTLAGLRFICRESPVAFAALSAVAVLRGFVAPATALLTARAVVAVPDAVKAGGGDGTSVALPLVLVAALYGADQLVDSLVFPLEEAWAIKLYARLKRRTMEAWARPPLIDHLLDAEVQRLVDLAGRQEWPHVAAFATAVLRATTWLTGLATQMLLVARFSPVLALLSTIGWTAIGVRIRHQELRAMRGAWDNTRRAHYYRRLALDHRNAGEVRTFDLGPWLTERYHQGWQAGMAMAWRRRAANGWKVVPLLVLLAAGVALGTTVIATQARAGALDTEELVVVVAAFIGLAQLALPQFWWDPLLWGAARLPALEKIEGIAERETRRVVPAHALSASGLPHSVIRFEGVTFGYPGRPQAVLRNVDLTIEAGTSLAVVGVNGAGKTTLVKLLARLHDPWSGAITVDGIDIRELDPVEWQHRVAAIFQEYCRYPLSAMDNVALGPIGHRPDPRLLAEVAEDAGAAQVVASLPHGWDTVLSRRYTDGSDLSGGEWQRIALARAVFAVRAGAGVLILDEPTANLDARGEAELFDRFLQVAKATTTLLISHRFSTVRRADRIVVLDGGTIAEEGTHDTLLSAGGLYAGLFSLQAERFRGDGARR